MLFYQLIRGDPLPLQGLIKGRVTDHIITTYAYTKMYPFS